MDTYDDGLMFGGWISFFFLHGLANAENAGMGRDLRIMLEVQNSVDRAGAVRVGTKESESGEVNTRLSQLWTPGQGDFWFWH